MFLTKTLGLTSKKRLEEENCNKNIYYIHELISQKGKIY